MAIIITGKEARKVGNEIDKVLRDIVQITQSDIDRTCDKIDSELNSCGRELSNSIKSLQQIKPLLDRLVGQIGTNAPESIQVLVQSIAQEISSKVVGSIDNQEEVRRNISDVDSYTDEIDHLTDKIEELTSKIDVLTDRLQG